MSTIKVNNVIPPNAGEGVTIDGLQMPTAGPLSNRNLIINGAMTVAQRGTSFTASEYTLDRWRQTLSGATATVTQETFTVGSEIAQSKNYLKQSVSTGNNFCGILYRHEGVRTISSGETVTFSFYAKGTNPAGGGLNFHVEQRFGTGGSPSSNVEVYDSDSDIVLTSDWTRYTISFTYDSYSGKTFGSNNDDFVQIEIRQKGSDTSTDAWELNITGVQLELGSKATPFEHESYGQTLAKCQRYFFRLDLGEATANTTHLIFARFATSSGGGMCYVQFPTTMRDNPTYTTSSSGTFLGPGGGYVGIPTMDSSTTHGAQLRGDSTQSTNTINYCRSDAEGETAFFNFYAEL